MNQDQVENIILRMYYFFLFILVLQTGPEGPPLALMLPYMIMLL